VGAFLTISGYGRQQLRQQHRRIAAANDERKRGGIQVTDAYERR